MVNVAQCGKKEIYSHLKIFREIGLWCDLAPNMLISRNFYEKHGDSRFSAIFTVWKIYDFSATQILH